MAKWLTVMCKLDLCWPQACNTCLAIKGRTHGLVGVSWSCTPL